MMKIKPIKVEYYEQIDGVQHVCRCSFMEDNVYNYQDILEPTHVMHASLRHQSCYYVIPRFMIIGNTEAKNALYRMFSDIPYVDVDHDGENVYVATNGLFVYEHPVLFANLLQHSATPQEFFNLCPNLFRVTLFVRDNGTRKGMMAKSITPSQDILTQEDYDKGNFVSMCQDIAKDRDVNFTDKDFYLFALLASEYAYNNIKSFSAEDILPMATTNEDVYTHSIKGWSRIIRENFGHHSDVFELIYKTLQSIGYTLDDNLELRFNHKHKIGD